MDPNACLAESFPQSPLETKLKSQWQVYRFTHIPEAPDENEDYIEITYLVASYDDHDAESMVIDKIYKDEGYFPGHIRYHGRVPNVLSTELMILDCWST